MNEKNRNITCFLIGFHRILIVIRSNIRNPQNMSLLETISKYCISLQEESLTNFEIFKSEIIEVVNEQKEIKELLNNALNVYEVDPITDNLSEIYRYLSVISDSALEICTQLRQKSFDRAYDLVDAIHCLPQALVCKKQWDPRAYWKIYIRPYRERWDKQFLENQERKLFITSFFKFVGHDY
ncbi:hypothetical protein [Acetivibrio mesophilus]|uniref:Uncharacterized protein n=1 Tax=Acetivibrio mesophilus TaxID=2487273 RepID=A0A4Q0I0A2_9FIRM|nr:hypothetical protein [Acetivibrio mesophilus]RXE57503.1 hypothetical protein EFD62_17385 [Acetivibrio mesophilus]